MYELYSTGARRELCGTPASVSLGVDNLPATKTLNFLWYGYDNIIIGFRKSRGILLC
jgi:hypothetical protein